MAGEAIARWRTCGKCGEHYNADRGSCPSCGSMDAVGVTARLPIPTEDPGVTLAKSFNLTIGQVQAMNRERALRWHSGGLEEWSGLEWAGALCGEAGELANVMKKLRRIETGAAGNAWSDRPLDEAGLLKQLADEGADVFCYLVLCMSRYGINLAHAVRTKFNKKSEEMGFPERL